MISYHHTCSRMQCLYTAPLLLLLLVSSACAQSLPRFELDPLWPQLPMGDNWLTGGLGGICVDDRDHIYLLNRQNVVADDLDGALLAPPIIELDTAGRVVQGWGGPQLQSGRLHDCHVDAEHNVWVVDAASGHVQKYAPDGGELLLQIGESGTYDSSDGSRRGAPLNSNRAQFFLPASIDVDSSNGDIYVADGELAGGNSRIAVMDSRGEFLRQWPLHRTVAERGLIQLPHCIRLSNDGLVYVCDRRADRIQVFDRQGNFIKNLAVGFEPVSSPNGRTSGSRGNAVVLAFSPDPQQQHLYVVNQNSVMIDVLDRHSGEKLASFGGGPGRYRGQFELPHGIAADSQGNIYVAEQEGRRVQKYRLVDSSR